MTTDIAVPALQAADSHDLIRGTAREQPQGRQRRAPEAPADRVHRRVRLGQELAGVRHDRRGVAAADQRDLQHIRAGLHADHGAARGRRARRADDGDHRRPGADGRRRLLHGRHRHRRQRDAAHPVQPPRAAAHRTAERVSPSTSPRSERAVRSRSSVGPQDRAGATFYPHGRHVYVARAGARSPTSTCPRCTTTASCSTRVRSRSRATAWTAGTAAPSAAAASSTRTSRSAGTPSGSSTTRCTRSRPRSRSRAST